MNRALKRFLRYAALDTTSNEESGVTPSTTGQWELAKILLEELRELGVSQPQVDEHCYVYGLIPANAVNQPIIALIAHLDTADAVPGRQFLPRVIRYEGGSITLNSELGIVMEEGDFPALSGLLGQELVVTDGQTVLGADDKAGIAEIMEAASILLEDPSIPHGDVWLVFTPDEEIGSGAALLQLDKIQADFAYTVDGGALNEIEYENFNAASARVRVKGRNVHPGYAKGQMINAIKVAMDYQRRLPQEQAPELTEGYEGFYHLRGIRGAEENAVMDYLIRDHDRASFEQRKQVMLDAADAINTEFKQTLVEVEIKDSYYNMKEVVDRFPHVVERAEKAIRACGMVPQARPIRGGTDGARLSFRGLPCPNLGTGGLHWHSVFEVLPVESLEKMAKVLVEIVRA